MGLLKVHDADLGIAARGDALVAPPPPQSLVSLDAHIRRGLWCAYLPRATGLRGLRGLEGPGRRVGGV